MSHPYTADELNSVLRDIIKYGIEIDPEGISHKRNLLDPSAPRLPIKIHLCTAEVRPLRYEGDPRLPYEVFQKMTHLMLRFLKAHGSPRISGIPNVGSAIVNEMYRTVFDEGGSLRIVRLIKERLAFRCVVETHNQEELWGVDDLLNLGDTKLQAVQAWKATGWNVSHLLTFLDYDRGGRYVLEEKEIGVEAHCIAKISALLLMAEREPQLNLNLTPQIIAQTRAVIDGREPQLTSVAA